MIKWGLFRGCKDDSISASQSMLIHNINSLRNKNNDHPNRQRKSFRQSSASTYDLKNPQLRGYRRDKA